MGKMRVVVQQAQFLPWIGFWHKVVSCDRWVVYGGAQYVKGGHESRVTLEGKWASLPVYAPYGAPMKDVTIADMRAPRRIARSIRQVAANKQHRYGHRLEPILERLESWDSHWLLDLTNNLMFDVMSVLRITVPQITVDSHSRSGDAIDKLERILVEGGFKGWAYLSGGRGLDYMGYDTLKTPSESRFQVLREGLDPNSIVQLIANHPSPLEEIRAAGAWQTQSGEFFDWQGEPCGDPRATP